MWLFTGKGEAYSTCAGWHEAEGDLWVRSPDKRSLVQMIQDMEQAKRDNPEDLAEARPAYVLQTNLAWDYPYRVHMTHFEWGQFCAMRAEQIDYGKVKPAVAAARGAGHPISKAVSQIFYWFSDNRTNGTTPAWLGGFGGSKDGSPEVRETSLTGFAPEREVIPDAPAWSTFDSLDDTEPSEEALALLDDWLERGAPEDGDPE